MSDIELDASVVDKEVVESKELLGRECRGCLRILRYAFFRKDASYRDGYRDLCQVCESAPRMSTEEHLWNQREKNYAAASAQRWAHQDDYRDDEARRGREMWHNEFLTKLQSVVPNLYITEGRIIGDLAIYRTYGSPQERLNGNSFEYLFFCPTGLLPEFSLYEIDPIRDVIVKEKRRGWRTPLLRLIRNGMLTEEKANETFGRAEGPGATVYLRKLFEHRNQKQAEF
jgi:hypothetical protein